MKIVYICHVSNSEIRSHLRLKNLFLENIPRRLLNKQVAMYVDIASWNEQFINIFKKDIQNEYYIISHHYGMKKEFQSYEKDNIHYTFIREERSLLVKSVYRYIRYDEKNNYIFFRKRINKVLSNINPDIVIVCGAENPIYSASVLDICKAGTPLLVILQTLLNSPKRIEMKVGSSYRRWLESEIFKVAKNFGTSDHETIAYLKWKRPDCSTYDIHFPSTSPIIYPSIEKDFDFCFFARGIAKFKGIEDVILALGQVVKHNPLVSLQIIGSCEKGYMDFLMELCTKYGIQDNVHYSGYCTSQEDVHKLVQHSKYIVVPGITASLNATVREGMLMSMPVICYESDAIREINSSKHCIISARKENVSDLAKSMEYVLNNPEKAKEIGQNGYEYALSHFTGESVGLELKYAINDILSHE